MKNNPQIPENPFEKIALSLSGGGYRAASFHLGSLSYLNHLKYKGKPLLENVKMLSTVSGGTITGAVYALKISEGKEFKEIYNFIFDKLKEIDLLKGAFELMQTGSKWTNKNKRKNLINAFALLYDQHFTGGKTMKDLKLKATHLDAVVFNSTEFDHGLNFRFRSKYSGQFGNNYFKIPANVGEEVKISDAIAASSCFPGGFEPIRWPQDFLHNEAKEIFQYSITQPEIGLMDGGIYDNQGIDSILMYRDSADKEKAYFDLVIVSDVSSPYMEGYTSFKDLENPSFLSNTYISLSKKIKKLKKLSNILFIILIIVLSTIPIIWQYKDSISTGIFVTLSFLILSLFLILNLSGFVFKTFFKIIKYCYSIKNSKSSLFEILSKLNFKDISLRRIISLLADRFQSINVLLNDVFLKVIRRHHYKFLYKDKNYAFRRITSLIKELTKEDFLAKNKGTKSDGDIVEESSKSSILSGTYDEVIGEKIQNLVEEASKFGTTLWFTEKEKNIEMLKKLVATGEVTMCYNMVEHLYSLIYTKGNGFEKLDEPTKIELKKMYKQSTEDWKKFKENPFSLLFNANSEISF